ncbi:ATP-binding cassette domain-containing protein [Mesorhizobium sp. M0904]|uniref:ATP-binding cassette domain-containing protein n=1 Tax=Mesorhizobium sp. M0904 TaxID=2957022 RepID=UPI0033392003
MSSVLSCDQLHSGYGAVEVLSGAKLKIKAGDIYALIGKNGAGKTTLLQTILGVLKPTAGSIKVLEKEVVGMPTHRIISFGLACAPQEKAFFNDLTVDENLRLGSLSLSKSEFVGGRDGVIEMFPFIANRLRQRAGTLSGGEQAMVKVARALLPKPKLVLLDEVTEGLQPITVNRVRNVLMRDHAERNTTILVVEQNVDFVAGFATRYGLMERGEIRAEGSFAEAGAIDHITEHLSI